MSRRALIPVVAAMALMSAACGSEVSAHGLVASSPGSVGLGDQRVLVGLIDLETNQSIASPDMEVVATLRDRNGAPLGDYPGEFIWTVPEVRGLYAFRFHIPDAGTYQITLDAEDMGEVGPFGLVALEETTVVSPGQEAPRSETRTTADHELAVISSDPDPDPSFYQLSVAEALDRGPSVIVFATPAWCATQTCGPLLDQVKEISADFPGIGFVHVEIYQDIQVATSDQLQVVEAVDEWRLPSEPWVFVVDARGVVTAAFEGAASDSELITAFQEVAR